VTKLFHPLLALIASASDCHLRRQVRYLKEENLILRARIPKQVHTRREERDRLLKFGLPLGPAIEELISIVTPSTFYRWRREAKRGKPSVSKPRGKSQILRDLVLKIARETGFGYTKILGELRSLGISRICRQTVKNILKQENIEPSPKRRRGTWDDYLKAHAETLWACDFFTKRAVTARGIVDLYVLVFMHLESREVVVSKSTRKPNSAWVVEQAQSFVRQTDHREHRPTILIHDRDTKFSDDFRSTLKDAGVECKKLPVRSPNLNARVERFVQTIKTECLDHFIAFGQDHLDYLVGEFVEHYNEARPRSHRNHRPPREQTPVHQWETIRLEEVVCRERLGGVIKSHRRAG
jgi:putative transposase